MNTIMVVDDERVIREGCSRILSSEGYRVLTAADGQEALDMLGSEPVDLILCDLKMPLKGALEVLQEASVLYPDIPLVVITGHGTVSNAVECMKLGAYEFITKPFRTDHLILIVERALENRALQRRTRELQEAQARNLYDLTMEKSRIRTITNCMADGVLVTNRELEVVLHNSALTRLLELPHIPPQPGTLADYNIQDALAEGLESMLEKNAEAHELISQEITRDKTHLRALSALIHGPDHTVLGTVTVFQDITRFKELDAMKSNFVHMVSHELRSPLATIKQQIAVILEGLAGEVTEKQLDLLTRSQDRIRALLELINDLLDVAKIESGQVMQQMAPLQLREVLEEITGFMKERALRQGIVLSLQAAPDFPLIHADGRCMEEVFTNLISNAINYSPDGGQVTVSALSHGSYVEILVSDTGIGIDPQEASKIFDKFYRVKHPRTRQVIGTGLGLAIVKGIIDSHQGSIEVESKPGVGTTFRILLPVLGSVA